MSTTSLLYYLLGIIIHSTVSVSLSLPAGKNDELTNPRNDAKYGDNKELVIQFRPRRLPIVGGRLKIPPFHSVPENYGTNRINPVVAAFDHRQQEEEDQQRSEMKKIVEDKSPSALKKVSSRSRFLPQRPEGSKNGRKSPNTEAKISGKRPKTKDKSSGNIPMTEAKVSGKASNEVSLEPEKSKKKNKDVLLLQRERKNGKIRLAADIHHPPKAVSESADSHHQPSLLLDPNFRAYQNGRLAQIHSISAKILNDRRQLMLPKNPDAKTEVSKPKPKQTKSSAVHEPLILLKRERKNGRNIKYFEDGEIYSKSKRTSSEQIRRDPEAVPAVSSNEGNDDLPQLNVSLIAGVVICVSVAMFGVFLIVRRVKYNAKLNQGQYAAPFDSEEETDPVTPTSEKPPILTDKDAMQMYYDHVDDEEEYFASEADARDFERGVTNFAFESDRSGKQ